MWSSSTQDHIPIAAQFLQSHGTAGMKLLSGNSHFTAEPELAAVGKAGGNIHIDCRTVDIQREFSGIFGIFGHGGKSSFHIPPFVKSLFKWIFFTALCIGAVILRRSFMLKLREKHFKSGKRADRISYIYAYAEKLLKFKKHENADSRFNEFADETERLYSKVYFDDGEFKKLTDIALHARFGKYKPSDDELKFAADMVNGIASKMYSKSGILGKLYLKFISVLI